jgi:hypothetical protein
MDSGKCWLSIEGVPDTILLTGVEAAFVQANVAPTPERPRNWDLRRLLRPLAQYLCAEGVDYAHGGHFQSFQCVFHVSGASEPSVRPLLRIPGGWTKAKELNSESLLKLHIEGGKSQCTRFIKEVQSAQRHPSPKPVRGYPKKSRLFWVPYLDYGQGGRRSFVGPSPH